jgi:hypothetical protein
MSPESDVPRDPRYGKELDDRFLPPGNVDYDASILINYKSPALKDGLRKGKKFEFSPAKDEMPAANVFTGLQPEGALCEDRHDHPGLFWVCTRPAGHELPHAVVTPWGAVVAKWNDDLVQWHRDGIK